MSGYTKGPWHVSGRLHIGSMHSPMVLASMNPVHLDTPANARLIAAAPDLLEALEKVSKALERYDSGHPLIADANIAIAKAKNGGSNV